MKELTVIGSCVCRDLFEKDNGINYSFKTDIRFTSPISMLSKPVNYIHADQNLFQKKVDVVSGNWYKKNLINDINKTAFDALKEKRGEYLIIDLAESRLPLANIRWKNRTESLLVRNSVSFRGHYKTNLSKNIFKGTTFEVINPLMYDDDLWKVTIENYVNKLKEFFEEDKIILIKTKPAKYYIDTKGLFHPYSTANHFNEILLCDLLLDKLNSFFVEFCPKCCVIDFPNDALGLQNHKWGNHPFHFTNLYYEYLLCCVNEIVLNKNPSGLGQIRNIFNSKFLIEREKSIFKSASTNTTSYDIDYVELLNRYEEFDMLGKKKKLAILFALDKKHFFKHFNNVLKEKNE